MIGITDRILLNYFKWRQRTLEKMMADPGYYQHKLLRRILKDNAETEYGKAHNFSAIKSPKEFSSAVPINTYEDLYPSIKRMMEGQKNILCRDEINWFAKSSGTSTNRSKYVPVSKNYLVKGHLKCAWDAASFIYNDDPKARLFADKSLIMGGSIETLPSGKQAGDISGIIIKHFPKVGKRFYTPDFETALMQNWDDKIKKMAGICSKEKLTLVAGVPSWLMVLFDEILFQTGADNIMQVWPGLRSFLHGGVSFEPYREQFKRYLPTDQINYREVYNASEGYFAIQNKAAEDGMLLLCDNEIYYEFQEWNSDQEKEGDCVELGDLEIGKSYALLISNSSGLYRYRIGDLVAVVSKAPLKIKITGRTHSMINVFGEEVSVSNTDMAISACCHLHKAEIKEYTVAPIYSSEKGMGAHEWLIEFAQAPENIESFAEDLDYQLRKLNSDYDAKRSHDLALKKLKLRSLSKGSFEKWMRSRSRYGGQNKVPRLRNDRIIVDEIFDFLDSMN